MASIREIEISDADVKTQAAIWNTAKAEIGVREIVGPQHNHRVVEYFAGAGHVEVTDDETPWCAAFVGSVLGMCGIAGTGSLLARSYAKWGRAVDLDFAPRGSVVVLDRPGGKSWQGHVGFLSHITDDSVYLLGGNQNNQVGVDRFPQGRIVAVRVAEARREGPPVQSKAVRAGAASLLSSGAAAAGTVASSVGMLGEYGQLIILGSIAVGGLFVLYMMRDRIRKWAAGVR